MMTSARNPLAATVNAVVKASDVLAAID